MDSMLLYVKNDKGYNKYAKGYSFYTEDFQIQGNLKKDAIITTL